MINENEYEDILETCVEQIASGASSLEQCLARYPAYASELEPVLSVAARLKRVRDVKPPPFLRGRVRANLTKAMKNNPRQKRGLSDYFWQMALNVGVLLVTLFTTSTALAQSALPGENLYRWKLNSEHVWRVISPDPLATDLRLADRRVNEYVAVSRDQTRQSRALLGYNELLVRFQAEQDEMNRERILVRLKSQQDSLKTAGMSIPELDKFVHPGP